MTRHDKIFLIQENSGQNLAIWSFRNDSKRMSSTFRFQFSTSFTCFSFFFFQDSKRTPQKKIKKNIILFLLLGQHIYISKHGIFNPPYIPTHPHNFECDRTHLHFRSAKWGVHWGFRCPALVLPPPDICKTGSRVGPRSRSRDLWCLLHYSPRPLSLVNLYLVQLGDLWLHLLPFQFEFRCHSIFNGGSMPKHHKQGHNRRRETSSDPLTLSKDMPHVKATERRKSARREQRGRGSGRGKERSWRVARPERHTFFECLS